MDMSLIISLGGFVVVIAGGVFAFGKRDARLEALEKNERLAVLEERVKEDREAFQRKFLELYESRNEIKTEVTEITASLTEVCRRLEKIEPSLEGVTKALTRVLARIEDKDDGR